MTGSPARESASAPNRDGNPRSSSFASMSGRSAASIMHSNPNLFGSGRFPSS